MPSTQPARPSPAVALPDREAEALAEIAATRGSTACRAFLALGFTLLCLAGSTLELSPRWRERTAGWPRETLHLPSPSVLKNQAVNGNWRGAQFELLVAAASAQRYVERDAVATRALRHPVQRVLTEPLRYGNGQVLVGEGPWLFYQHDLYHVVGPPFLSPTTWARRTRRGTRLYPTREPNPLVGLFRLHRQLKRRGIQLVFLPVPAKPEVLPSRLAAGAPPAPLHNASFDELVDALEGRGIPVFDPTSELVRLATEGVAPFLEEDTHWSPAGMRATAAELARFLRRRGLVREASQGPFEVETVQGTARYELERMLGFDRAFLEARNPPDRHFRIQGPTGERIDTRSGLASVVLLGDSFSMIYRSAAGDAGFGEFLAAELGLPVRSLVGFQKNELGQRTTWLREQPELLRSARVVVYEVTARALSIGDWTPSPLGAPGRPPSAPARPARPGSG